MPGMLVHSPADIIRYLLIAKGGGTLPSDGSAWPIFESYEPDQPDNAITLFNTLGVRNGRTHTDGEVQEHHGIQLRIRATHPTVGYAKARALALILDEQVYRDTVDIDGAMYVVWEVNRTSDVLELGKESPETKRHIYTINAIVSVRES